MFSSIAIPVQAAEQCDIAWSRYTGWEPLGYIEDSGIADRWGEKEGVNLSFSYVGEYIESVNLYNAGTYQGVAITTMDALTIPAVGGVDTTVIIIGDFSNGNDAILIKDEDKSINDLRDKEIILVELSVSHYLLARALGKVGMSERDINLVNTSDTAIPSLIATANQGDTFVTWNPIVMKGLQQPGISKIFDSSEIPGEIIDTIVVNTDVSENCKRAVAGAWYEAMGTMSSSGNDHNQMISFMAEQSGGTVPEFKSQLKTTRMFYDPAEAIRFIRSPELQKTMEFVARFSFDHGIYGDGAPDEKFVGIQYPSGVWGNEDYVRLRFDPTYMELAAEGKL